MKNLNVKNIFGIWMVLMMAIIGCVFTSCEKLDEDLDTRVKTTSTTTPKTSIYAQNKNREVINNTTERISFEKVVKVGNADPVITKIELTLKRELKGIDEYEKEVSSFEYAHKQNNPIIKGTAAEARTEGYWTVQGRTDQFSALLVNGMATDDVTTSYSFYHEAATYKDSDIEVSFDFVEPTFSEKSTTVTPLTSIDAKKEKARLNNVITTTYYSYKQDASESVVLWREKGVTITSEDWVNSSCKETINNNNVVWTLLYRVNKSDGSHDDYNFEFTDSRDITVEGPWSSTESNNSQTTSSVSKSQTGSTEKTASKDGATAKWNRYSYTLTSIATLAGSKQNNVVKTVEPEGFEITFRGKTHKFSRPSYTVSNNKGTVTGGNEQNGYKVYDYTDKFSYVRGANSQSLNTKGTIRVKVVEEEPTFFPKEWGTLLDVKQTVANNESHNSFVYTWSLRFANGYVLPVVIRSGSNIPEWHFEYAEKTTVTTYNGGTYDKGSNTWINTTAKDMPNQMTWSRQSKEKANKDYQIAKNQNWDEGHLVNGHASTQTSRYQLTVSNGRLTAKDTYTGTAMGSWK